MSGIPPPVPHSADQTHNAYLLNSAQLSHDGHPSRSQLPPNLDGGLTHNPGCKNQEIIPTFSQAIKLRVGGLRSGDLSRTRPECHVHPTSGNMKLANKVKAAHSSSPDFDLTTMSLFGKIWGESIPFHLIRVRTKWDWVHVKGQVDYVDMGNGWILFKFFNVHDREYVWSNRPWFVNGLNLVLKPWAPPYAAKVTHVDQ